jgi:hypothetical protein
VQPLLRRASRDVKAFLALLALVIASGAVGCGSPEASRARGGGAGGDVGNRARVELHGGSEIYYGTPVLIPGQARGGPAPASRGARPSG